LIHFEDLELALKRTCKNIDKDIQGGVGKCSCCCCPTILWSGNGFHVYQPVNSPLLILKPHVVSMKGYIHRRYDLYVLRIHSTHRYQMTYWRRSCYQKSTCTHASYSTQLLISIISAMILLVVLSLYAPERELIK
jgi:hypothetical protein